MNKKRIVIFVFLTIIFCFQASYTLANTDSLQIQKLHQLLRQAESYRVKSFEMCLDYAQQAQDLAKKTNKIKELAEATKTIGVAHYFQGNYQDAIKYYKEAKSYYELIHDDIGIAKIYNNIGIIYQRWSEYDSAHTHYYRSLDIYEKLNDTLGKAGALNNIGNIEFLLEKYNPAIQHFQEAYRIFEMYDNKYEQANALNNIGFVYEKENKLEKALKYYFGALAIRKNIIDNYGIGVSLNNIGVIYYRQKHYKEAMSYLFKALTTREELGHLDGVVATKTLIGEIYGVQGLYKKALQTLNDALVLANQGNLRNKKLDIYMALNEILYFKKKYDQAYHYLSAYIALKDSIYNENKLEQIAEIEARYENDKKRKEIKILRFEKELQSAEIRKQKLLRNIFVLSGLFVLIIVFLIYSRYRLILKNKELLEEQNKTIKAQHQKITDINKNLTDSIVYSKYLLASVLPQKEYIRTVFQDFFILNKPKDIVSGDFYWIKKNQNKIIVTVADCTGHGVPGAIMSMLGISFLNEIVGKKTHISASEILDELRMKVIETLHQTGKKKENKDGIDIALCIIDTETKTLEFSGAFNNAYIIKNGELNELKGDKKPIGIYVTKNKKFTSQNIAVQPGDIIYLSSDGFFHQFGGQQNLKFSSTSFKKLLLEIHKNPFNEQLRALDKTITDWKGANEQVDDIMVFGAKIM